MEHYGTNGVVCHFILRHVHGAIGDGFIQVHHLRELSSIGEEYQIDPIADLRLVGPNCHALLHTSIPALSIADLYLVLHKQTATIADTIQPKV